MGTGGTTPLKPPGDYHQYAAWKVTGTGKLRIAGSLTKSVYTMSGLQSIPERVIFDYLHHYLGPGIKAVLNSKPPGKTSL
jgi:hypothetical protein